MVIVGGGFGGLAAAHALGKLPVNVTLVDKRNHHVFQPLLYQVATAELNASDIAHPIRAALAKQRNTRVLLAEARSIDVAKRRVILDNGALDFDYLVVATGATHSISATARGPRTRPGSSRSRTRSRFAAACSSHTKRPSASPIARCRPSG